MINSLSNIRLYHHSVTSRQPLNIYFLLYARLKNWMPFLILMHVKHNPLKLSQLENYPNQV